MKTPVFKSIVVYVCHLALATVAAMVLCSIFVITDFLAGIFGIFYFRLLLYSAAASLAVMLISIAITVKGKSAGLKSVLNVQGIMSAFIISFLLIYSFLSVTTFTNERSYTIFSLGYLYENPDTVYSQSDMEKVFIDRFVLEGGATQFRIDEQLRTGYIEEVGEGYRISESGKHFIRLQRFIDIFFPVSSDPSSLYPYGRAP